MKTCLAAGVSHHQFSEPRKVALDGTKKLRTFKKHIFKEINVTYTVQFQAVSLALIGFGFCY